VADPSWSLYSWFLACYHLPCYYFRPVSYLLPFNTCISLGNYVIAWPLDMPLFGKTLLLLYHDLTWLLSISRHDWLLVYHHLSCYHLTPSMIHLTLYNYHDEGNVVSDLLLWIPVMITVMFIVMTCYDLAHSRNLIIMFISYKKDNLYGYGRKWWMPEWYLAYSMGRTYIGGTVMITIRGTMSLQTGPRWWEPLDH